ncbi:MAG: hypothetical protein ACAI38_12335 [Myxococcota bacterium]
MTSYLRAGWFDRSSGKPSKGLRTEVIDGAMDAAGFLLRANISGATVLRLALRVRALMAIADPRMLGVPKFGERERELVMNGLARHTDATPELYAFVADCVDGVNNLTDLMAFYLHLTHVARMIELLSVAVRNMPQMVSAPRPARRTPAKKKAAPKKRAIAKKKPTKKKAAKKKPTAKQKSAGARRRK